MLSSKIFQIFLVPDSHVYARLVERVRPQVVGLSCARAVVVVVVRIGSRRARGRGRTSDRRRERGRRLTPNTKGNDRHAAKSGLVCVFVLL